MQLRDIPVLRHPEKGKVLIASMQRGQDDTYPQFLGQVLRLIAALGRDNVAVAVGESGSPMSSTTQANSFSTTTATPPTRCAN